MIPARRQTPLPAAGGSISELMGQQIFQVDAFAAAPFTGNPAAVHLTGGAVTVMRGELIAV